MKGLHQRGLWSLLENNKCKRVSVKGLVNDHPKSHAWLKQHLLEKQLYLLLSAIENKREEVDISFDIYITHDEKVILFDKRTYYTQKHCEMVCQIGNIDPSIIADYKDVKPL